MTEDAPKRNKGGRPAKYPGEGRRPTLSLRVRGGLYEKLQAAAEASERTISEEMERRLEESFMADDIAETTVKAVVKATDALAYARTRSTQTVFATLEEYEKYCGGKDACSFGYHVGKQLALCIKDEGLKQDLLGRPLNPPEEAIDLAGTPWFESEARRERIRSKMLESVSGLFDIWTFIQESSPIPSVGWQINQRVESRIASGEFDRRPDEDPLEQISTGGVEQR